MKYLISATFVLLTPLAVHAAVTINEIAWMGTENSANDEWIELYNSGAPISLDGWILTDETDLSIPLAGALGAGEYAVLERTDDSSVSGSAFLVYTGALSNAGATLMLKRPGGATEDQVAGGEDWENIGGDNTTKETAQYTKHGWTTGTPTPGKPNVSYMVPAERDDYDEDTEEDYEDMSVVSLSSSPEDDDENKSVSLILPDITLNLTLIAPKRAYVHQPIEFTLEGSEVGSTIRDSLKYSWNFGDLTTATGEEVAHRYEYPGTYVVVAHAEYKRQHATVRHEITVLPVAFSVTRNEGGDLQIHNDARYEVDLSGYSLRGDRTIVFPENTILLPNATLTIPRERGVHNHAFLLDQDYMVVASTISEHDAPHIAVVQNEVETVALETTQSSPAPPYIPHEDNIVPSANSNFSFMGEREKESKPEDHIAEGIDSGGASNNTRSTTVSAQPATVNQANIPIDSEKLPYLGLIGVLSLGLLAIYAGKITS